MQRLLVVEVLTEFLLLLLLYGFVLRGLEQAEGLGHHLPAHEIVQIEWHQVHLRAADCLQRQKICKYLKIQDGLCSGLP